MKYDANLAKKITDLYNLGATAAQISETLCKEGHDAPERSVISKLSSLGVYKKKQYLTKRGEPPIKKSEYIEKIAVLLKQDVESLESLEKVTKGVLVMLLGALTLGEQTSQAVKDLEE